MIELEPWERHRPRPDLTLAETAALWLTWLGAPLLVVWLALWLGGAL